MRHQKAVWGLLAVACLTGCRPPAPESDGGEEHEARGQFRVALLSPGPIDDAGWNASAFEGLQAIERELSAEVSQQEVRPAEFEEAFRDYAGRGYRIVFAHGFEFGKVAEKLAPDFPDTVFVVTAGVVNNGANVISIVPELEQATYVLGALAASLSDSGKLGCVGGQEIPPVRSTFAAFEAGAHHVRGGTTVSTAYVGNWEDQNKAKEATLALIDQGADFIFHNADQAGLGCFKAVQERKGQGVLAFGSNRNQNEVAPDVVLASAVLKMPEAFLHVAQQVQDESFDASDLHMKMSNGYVAIEYNPALADRIPAEVKQAIDQLQAQVVAGEVNPPQQKS